MKYIFILCIFIFAKNSFAQIIVAGFVTSKETKEGISAKIKIKRAVSDKIVAVTRSSKSSGSYFTRVKPGLYKIEVSGNGYETLIQKLDLSSVSKKRSLYKNFELSVKIIKEVKEKGKKEFSIPKTSFIEVDKYQKRQLKRIGLMFSVRHKEAIQNTDPLSSESKQFLAYFRGAQMAIDSLRRSGFNIELIILDNERDSAKTAEIIRSGMIDSLDILIGPIYNNLFKQTLRYCHAKQIINVSPLTVSHLNLLSPFYYMMSPSVETHALEISKWLRKNHLKKHKVLIHDEKFNKYEKEFIRFFSKLPLTDTIIGTKPSPEEITLKLKKNRPNIILLASSEFSYSYYILSQLSLLEEEYEFTVIGMPHWVKFQGIDVEYLTKNNVIFSTNCWIDKDTDDLKSFENNFLSTIKTLPNKYAYMGFDHIFTLYPLLYVDNNAFLKMEMKGFTSSFKIKAMNRRSKVRRHENANIKILQFTENGINIIN